MHGYLKYPICKLSKEIQHQHQQTMDQQKKKIPKEKVTMPPSTNNQQVEERHVSLGRLLLLDREEQTVSCLVCICFRKFHVLRIPEELTQNSSIIYWPLPRTIAVLRTGSRFPGEVLRPAIIGISFRENLRCLSDCTRRVWLHGDTRETEEELGEPKGCRNRVLYCR